MSRLFIFALGGTGAKVMQALTMLMSAGELPDQEIVPIMLDFDVANGNLHHTIRLMDRYSKIHGQNINSNSKDFFSSSLTSIEEIANGTNDHLFTMNTSVNHQNMYVRDLLEYYSLHWNDSCTLLLDSLFSTRGWQDELSSELCMGAKGNAKIARIGYAALRIQDSLEFRTLLMHFQPDEDKIVIIGSTFGGTGCAGVIEILKCLKNNTIVPVDNMNISTVLVEPYFLPRIPNNLLRIDYQNEFRKRSKVFFNFYHELGMESAVNTMYKIGMDDFLIVENAEFGDRQRSMSHPVELLSAMAICEYALSGKEGQYEYCFGRHDLHFGHEHIDLHDFYQMPGDSKGIFESLTRYLLSAFFIKECLKDNPLIKRSFFYYEIQGRFGLRHTTIVDLDRLFSYFLEWIKEMSNDINNKYRLSLFDVNAPMGEIVKGYSYNQHQRGFFRFHHQDILRDFIDRMNQNYSTSRTMFHDMSTEQVLIKLLSDSSRDILQQFKF